MTEEGRHLVPKPKEGIRAWYGQKTRRAIRSLFGASAILILAGFVVWLLTPMNVLQHIQTFNGALVIPGFGGLWIAAFMFIWLIPMREVSFRGQEIMERMEDTLDVTMRDKVTPAVEAWQRLGERLEKDVIPKFEAAIERIQASAETIEKKIVPAIEVARRIEGSVMVELQMGLLRDLKMAAESVNLLVMTKGEMPAPPPDLSRTLASLDKSTNGGRS